MTVNWTHCIALLLARTAPASSISWTIFTLARPTDCWIPPSLASPDLATEAGPDLWAAQDTVSGSSVLRRHLKLFFIQGKLLCAL